ncbi:MAG: FAD-binding oxidoreductase, partial [Rhabdochlamydiaceae bacterium]
MRTSQEFRRELSSIVGEEYVVDDAGRLEAYTHDNTPFPSVPPCIAVKPSSIEEVSDILRLANSHRNQVLVRGGGFSLTGLVRSDPERTIILETTRLNRIREIDEANMVVQVECGIIMGDLEKALEKRGMYVHTVTVPVKYVTLG